ncbi:hypothetical protein GcM3_101022 [Golovinomyces cichoracearum]|uniref:MULE transposase domain-containing protein n=1 Tax=Golovinomyces cichoracearum TaxID=62708 RepID=A0A420IA75_9PEZI|nr:hypothetical protein GcM3_101022 [Golovinomyces cichoracearum]
MQRFCFILLVIRSSHNHHPPYPTWLPKDIKEQVQEILMSVDILTTSSRRLLVSPVYAQICNEFGVSRLSRLYASLGSQDRFTALIREERLHQYPAGTDYAGVSREFQIDRIKDSKHGWSRPMQYLDEKHYLIICCTYAQAKAFEKDEAAKHTNTYFCAFINTDTRESYATMFKEIFRVLDDVGRFSVQVGHIHHTEDALRTVTVDMCNKQASGKF